MMLLMLVGLSSYCQYPTTKKIGKDSVVIMTVEQAENINNQFTRFKDSIETIHNKTIVLHQKVDTAYFQNKIMLDSLTKAYDSLKRATKAMNSYYTQKVEAVSEARETRKDFRVNSFLAFVGLGIFAIGVLLLNGN